jgi:putative transposase
VDAVKSKGAEPVTLARSHRKISRDYDRYIYKGRNAIERMFNKIKQFWRIATRYDKLSIAYLSFLHVAAIAVWLG